MLLIGMKNIHVQNPIGILSLLANPGLTWSYCSCWFARDVMAAMLVIKNKSISLRWELNIFMQILQEKSLLYWPPIWPPCHVVANEE